MKDKEVATNFPIEIDNPFIMFLQKIILWGVYVLAVLMTIVIFWGIFDIGYFLFNKMWLIPNFGFEDILESFGAFLVVLIAIEIFVNVILYLRKDIIHLNLVIATALMAIARKVIILDYNHVPPLQLFGIGVIIVALGVAYWFTNRSHKVIPV